MIDFTVLIPVYNTPSHIFKEAVDSILNQSHPSPNPIVIVNDGSSKTETLRMLIDFQHDARFHVINLKFNQGVSKALNVGHEYIKSEYIAVMGSDDISHLDRFKKQVEYLDKNTDVEVLGTQIKTFWNHDPKERKGMFTSMHKATYNKVGFGMNHGTVIYKNQSVKDVGGYDESKRKGQDIDLFNRMVLAKKKMRNLSDVLYHWRRFDKNHE